MKSETRGTAWKCSTCDKEFKYESEKRRHEQSHVPQFECKVCSKKFSFVSALRRHEKQHERTDSVHCSKCKGRFRDETLLKRHIQYAHKGKHQCKKCRSIFNSKLALQIHMKTHKPESERKFRCSYDGCTKSFNFAHHLKHHELTHTDDKPHVCMECGKGFIQLHHLKVHQRVHEPASWLTCVVLDCDKEFTNEYALKRHIATHKNKTTKSTPSDSAAKRTTAKTRTLKVPKPRKTRRHFPEDAQDIINISVSSSPEFKLDIPHPTIKSVYDTENISKMLDTNTIKVGKEFEIIDMSAKDNFEEFDTEGVTVYENVEIDDIDLSSSNCKSVIGKCIVTGDLETNESCLCAQMTTTEKSDELHGVIPPKTNNNFQVNLIDDLKCIEKRRKDINACETCECASICEIRGKIVEDFDEIEIPKLESRNDGVIKIKDSFDINFGNINSGMKEIIENRFDFKAKVDMMNSCKDILGNCIVSGDGTMGEGCLCARMTAVDQQIIDQEIEEITPCPKSS